MPGSPGASLLQMTFFATAGASGLFGIYAVEGLAATDWTDDNFNGQFFTNVPDGTGMVLIGQVELPAQAVPEPSGLGLLTLGGLTLLAWRLRHDRRREAV